MKLINSRLPRTTVKVPVMGGFTVQFHNYKAVVPDAVAAVLLGHPNHSDGGSVGDAVQNATVLVVRDNGMGDVLLTTPLIRKLHVDKGATVDVLTYDRYRSLFVDNPHVRETFALETFGGDKEALLMANYDLVLDLRLVVENADAAGINDHRADAFAAYADIELSVMERRPNLFLSEDEMAAAGAFRAKHFQQVMEASGYHCPGIVAYVWNSSTTNRNWSEVTHAANLAALQAAGYVVVILGGYWLGDKWLAHNSHRTDADDQPIADADTNLLDLRGFTDVRQAAMYLSACDAVITPDTGLFHLAGALDVPTLAYFGAFPVEERAAHKSLVVLNDASVCSLSPCRSYRCFNRDENGQARCLSVSPASVVARLNDTLKNAAKDIAHASVEQLETADDAQKVDSDAQRPREGHFELGNLPASNSAGTFTAPPGPIGFSAGGGQPESHPRPLLQSGIAERPASDAD